MRLRRDSSPATYKGTAGEALSTIIVVVTVVTVLKAIVVLVVVAEVIVVVRGVAATVVPVEMIPKRIASVARNAMNLTMIVD